MERQLKIIAYILARMLSWQEGNTVESILDDAMEATQPTTAKKKTQKPAPKVEMDAVDRVYSLYPTKCPISGRATGKSSKDKVIIERLLKSVPEKNLADIIKRYIKESIEQQSYIKNFSTLLNNLPDYETPTLPIEQEEGNDVINEAWMQDYINMNKGFYDDL
jgi:hypothetical protein